MSEAGCLGRLGEEEGQQAAAEGKPAIVRRGSPLHSALMWGRPCTIAGSWGKARDTSRDCPSCDKGSEGMWSQVLLCCVPALPGDLGAGTSTCAHLPGQRSPLYFSCPASLSPPFPQLSQGKELLQGLQLLLTCPWHVLSFPETAPCPALHILCPTPFLSHPQDHRPAGRQFKGPGL